MKRLLLIVIFVLFITGCSKIAENDIVQDVVNQDLIEVDDGYEDEFEYNNEGNDDNNSEVEQNNETDEDDQNVIIESSDNSGTNFEFSYSYVDMYPNFEDLKNAEWVEFRLVEYLCYEEGTVFADAYFFRDMVSDEIIEVIHTRGEATFYGGRKYVLALTEDEVQDRYFTAGNYYNAIFRLPYNIDEVFFSEKYTQERVGLNNEIFAFLDEVGIIYDGELSDFDRGEDNDGICNNPQITDDFPTISDLMNSEYSQLYYVRIDYIEDDRLFYELVFTDLITLETIEAGYNLVGNYDFVVGNEYIILLTKITSQDNNQYFVRDSDSIIEIVNDEILFPSKYLDEREGLENSIDSFLEELGLK